MIVRWQRGAFAADGKHVPVGRRMRASEMDAVLISQGGAGEETANLLPQAPGRPGSGRPVSGPPGGGTPEATTGPTAPPADRAMPGFVDVRAEMMLRTRVLARLVRSIPGAATPAVENLLRDLETSAGDMNEANSEAVKERVRNLLWPLREAFEADQTVAPAVVKTALDKARTVCFDMTWETAKQLQPYPGQHCTVRPAISDIANFVEVSPQLLRGGQPTQDGVDWLVGVRGVRTEVDLRGPDRDNEWQPPRWPEHVQRHWYPTPDMEAPSFDDVMAFDKVMQDEKNWPVYLHCKAGIGRTGTMIACWRIMHGWTADEAIELERRLSYGAPLTQEPAIRQFERDWLARKASERL
jgi:protein tyrosine phosphatase (PTP) superfamily phosphohydrolase (DUF442 family)